MSIPLPSFTQQRTQVQITSPQTIQFNPAISVITSSPGAASPQAPTSGLYQPVTAAQRADDRTHISPFEFGRALSFPLGDVENQTPGITPRTQGVGAPKHFEITDVFTSPWFLIAVGAGILYAAYKLV